MILWMKTEEMAVGELLERLRTVTRSIDIAISGSYAFVRKCEENVLRQEDESSNRLRVETNTDHSRQQRGRESEEKRDSGKQS
ncbi:Complement C3 [Dissostichus eleginoides]|uniref:Complement C3 n=1 Tax=Dissostichus eleginoides TaxID=100907 RepID=A0AAD9CIU6_DISEL|nr:Complement C3 [Dissostichus eleginoides]